MVTSETLQVSRFNVSRGSVPEAISLCENEPTGPRSKSRHVGRTQLFASPCTRYRKSG